MSSLHRFKCRLFGAILMRLRSNRFDYLGLSVELHPDTAPDIAYLVYRQRYELPEATLIERYVNKGDNVIELGASSGIISALIAREVGPDGRHVAVEANPNLTDLIRRNAGEHIDIEKAAVSYVDEEFVRFNDSNATLGNRIVDKESTGVLVPIVRLEDLIERHALVDPVLVCDIEGAELDIVQNGSAGLRACRAIIMEIHPELDGETLYNEDSFLRALEQTGFVLKERISRVVYLEREC